MELLKKVQETQEVLNGFFQGTAQNDPEAIVRYIADDAGRFSPDRKGI